MSAKNIQSQATELQPRQVDPNPYWSSSLFHEVFLRNDAPKKYASIWDQDSGFERFHQEFHNFVVETEDEDFSTWSESDTIKNWIVHIMEMLGWHDRCEARRQNPFIEELSLTVSENGRKRTYRADLVYVDEPKHKQFITKEKEPEKRLREARSESTGARMVVEAKYWDRLEQDRQSKDADKKRSDVNHDDGTRHLDPNDQILKYMDILNLDFGILTDGKTWRLFHKELSKGDVRRFFEFDLGNLAELVRKGIDKEKSREKFLNEARYFYFLFRKASLVQSGTEAPLVYQILEYSKKYAHSIEEDLKGRFIEAMGIACNALRESITDQKIELDLDLVRNVAESHLFNILFMRSCETRKILPLHCPDYHRISLTEVIESLDVMEFDPDKGVEVYLRFLKLSFGTAFSIDGTQIYDRLMKLYKVVHDGDMGFGIAGFKESVFSEEEWAIARKHKIKNEEMLKILFCLNFTDSEYGSQKYQQIPYNFFTPRQLGSIYESFLDFKIAKAEQFMVFTKRQWREADKESETVRKLLKEGAPCVSAGGLYFTPDNRDRKMTGSFYTPDEVVEFLVKETLDPLCRGKRPEQILKLTVCDPAAGSGHFLSSVLRFLVSKYRQAIVDHEVRDVNEIYEETARRVLDACVFGMDVNPRAVKLAKMNLWLATALINRKLERLDDQVCQMDSLNTLEWKLVIGGRRIDAVVGNPPYIQSRDKFLSEEQKNFFYKNYATSEYQINTYALFVEASLRNLSDGGRLGFIIPNYFISTDYDRKLRSLLFAENTALELINVHKVFQEANVDTTLLIEAKAKPSAKHKILIKETDGTSIRSSLLGIENRSWALDSSISISDLDQSYRITFGNSIEMPGEMTLSDFFDFKKGMQPYELGKGTPPQTEEMMKNKVYHHSSNPRGKYKKLITARDVADLNVDWGGQYIEYGKNLAAPREIRLFRGTRILVRRIVSKERIPASICKDEMVCNTDVIVLLPKGNIPDDTLKFLVGLITCGATLEWMRSKNVNLRRQAYPKINVNSLESVPVVDPSKLDPEWLTEVVSAIEKRQLLEIDRLFQQYIRAHSRGSRVA